MDMKGLTATCRDEVPFGSWSELKDAKKTRWTPGAAIITNHEHHLYIQAHHYIIRSGEQNARI